MQCMRVGLLQTYYHRAGFAKSLLLDFPTGTSLYSVTSELYDRTLVYHNIMRCSHSLDILQHAELCKVTYFALSIIHKSFKISIKSDIHP